MFTESFSQQGFKVQIACVNMAVLRASQEGMCMCVCVEGLAGALLLEH